MEMDPEPARTRPADPFEGLPPLDEAFGRSSRADLDDDPLAGLSFDDDRRDGGRDGDRLDGDDGLDAFSDLVRRSERGDDDLGPDLDDLLAQDTDPIPEMYARTGETTEHHRKGGKVLGVLLGLAMVVALIAAAGWFARSEIVRSFPEVESVYSALGVPVDVLGLGLRFRNVTSERLVQDGVDTLVVRGFIANTSDKPRALPHLRLALFDERDAAVQDTVAQPPSMELVPGETAGFRITLDNPSAAARRFEVDWTAPPKTAEGVPPAAAAPAPAPAAPAPAAVPAPAPATAPPGSAEEPVAPAPAGQ